MTKLTSSALFALVVVACGDSGGGDEGNGAGSGGGGMAGSSAGSGASDDCNMVSNTAATIDEDALAEDAPAGATGGTIVEGTYHLTSHTTYVGASGIAGPSGHTRKQTLVVTSTDASRYEAQSAFSKDGEPDERLTFVFTLQGLASASTTVAVDLACPAPMSFGVTGFSATPTTFTLHGGEVQVYTLE